jgi:hypothetical protein
MADEKNFDENGMRIRRERRLSRKIDKDEIIRRVLDFAKLDETARAEETDRRLQRYAKFRQWTEGSRGYPWDDSSDVALPDMATDVLAMEDTLHNAVMSNRPFANAQALQGANPKKEKLVDELLDTQIFIEQDGETAIGEMASCFVMDGNFVAYIPWVREDRKMSIYQTFGKFGDGEIPLQKFRQIVTQEFPANRYDVVQKEEQGWDWEVTDRENPDEGTNTSTVKFYTAKDGEIEMTGHKWTRIYDGPKIIVKDYEDVLTPPDAANLQIPGPKNPGGATHVILVDHPPIDEIQRLKKSGFYDLLTKEDLDKITNASDSRAEKPEKDQKAVIAGKVEQRDPDDDSHKTLTRYLCFDLYDIDGDGINTDMMWWVLKEPAVLLKAKSMTEMYPADPPRRPLAEACFIPVKGRREGIGLLELTESMCDFKKQIFDQMVDAGNLGNLPFWFYRPTSNIKPEVMKMAPGDGYPLQSPKDDVFFPNIGAGQAQSFGINMLTLADQRQEKVTSRSDLTLGRIPVGRSAALRTSENMASMQQAGEARPQRILRRFLMGLMETCKQFHELNQAFLPEKKKFRIVGICPPEDDPYREVIVAEDLKGRFQFDFSVNIMNASKIAVQQAMERIMGVYISELPITLGITTPDGVYRMLSDWGKAHGQVPERYISPPSPEALLAPIFAVEALQKILTGEMPEGFPIEGAQKHLETLALFRDTENLFALLDHPDKVALFRTYYGKVLARAKMEQAARAAGPMGAAPGGPQGAGGPTPNMGPPQVQENELIDETMPTAGGGGNGGMGSA